MNRNEIWRIAQDQNPGNYYKAIKIENNMKLEVNRTMLEIIVFDKN